MMFGSALLVVREGRRSPLTHPALTQWAPVTLTWPCCKTQRAYFDMGMFFQLRQFPPPFAPGLSGALEMFLHLTLRVIMVWLSQKAASPSDFQGSTY